MDACQISGMEKPDEEKYLEPTGAALCCAAAAGVPAVHGCGLLWQPPVQPEPAQP